MVRGTSGTAVAEPALLAVLLATLAVLFAGCSAAGELAGWCGRAERVVRLEAGRDRVVLEAASAAELAEAYGALAAAVPRALADDAALLAEFTAAIRADLDAGASSIAVIDAATRAYDVAAVESAHARILDAAAADCDR